MSDAVFTALSEEILTGRFAPGYALPGERDLAASFNVNRHAVREALKRLQQVGLVAISQGGPTKVLDWRTSAGLDALVPLAYAGRIPPAKIIDDVREMRVALGVDAARLCALRANAEQVEAVVAAAEAYPDAPSSAIELSARDLIFWTAVIDGTNNLAYRLGLNTLASTIAAVGQEHIAGLLEEYANRDRHLELAGAIARHSPHDARGVAQRLLAGGEQ